MKTFRELKKYLKHIPCIHYGGCGWAALAMYRWLKKTRPKLPVDIVFCYRWEGEESYETNSKFLKKGRGPISGCYHVCLKRRGKLIDCEGKVKERLETQHIVSEEFLVKALKRAEWNSDFDRGIIPFIEEKTGIKLIDAL